MRAATSSLDEDYVIVVGDLRPCSRGSVLRSSEVMSSLVSTSHYLSWGWVQVSVANLIVIAVMVLVFACAVVFRLPSHQHTARREEEADDGDR